MQSSSLLCSSNSLSPSPATLPTSHRFAPPVRNRSARSHTASSRVHLSLSRSQNFPHAFSPLHSTATQEIVETSKTESEFIEIGYISGVHGLQGEIRIKHNTDFPELRFSKPGRRWLRQQFSGRHAVQEVELVEGRGHPGQKGWIVRFSGIDSVEQAKQLVGSSILVREEDRPQLEEGEYYTRDLVGMRVFLKETGEPVGTVVNVFNSGANDLLEVMLDSPNETSDGTGNPKSETGVSGPLVWVPFVEAIVPNVDMDRREMQITPPKGLLELNLRSDERSKKERRQLEWKERKKFQRRLIAAKKKLCEMEQQHVFHGFRCGGKAQTSLLSDQIIGVNSKLLQQALQNIEISSKRWNLSEFISANSNKLVRNTLKVSEECITHCGSEEHQDANFKLQEKGLHLTSKGKVATVLVVNNSINKGKGSKIDVLDPQSTANSSYSLLQTLLCDDKKFVKVVEDRASVPLIVVCPAHEIQSIEKLFSTHDHFSFDFEKVWFLEEEKLLVISSSPEEQNRHKILMKSPWEFLQSPVGSGGVISLLSSHNILENLSEMGVEYIEICSINQRYAGGHSLFLGLVDSQEADIGIQIFKDAESLEENFDIIFSMKFIMKLTKQINKLQFHAIPKLNSHVEKVDKEWVDVIPSTPNSYELRCSIYSSLNACSTDKVCVMEITE
ncbi:hypothetical protein L1049_010637 [Liquidambar formosana]|uniref:Ribosome maturation factor RimM n=1 Tax=Liquidambar formosana TaxID=63359 RepID=A0AAP0NBG4_LIQFO